MAVSSEFPLAAVKMSSVLVADAAQGTVPRYVEDDEFPADLPPTYDWMLQAASRRRSRRMLGFIAVVITILLIAAAAFAVHNLSTPSASALLQSSTSN